jgi:Ser/Thr protein kinase RdoA (MazF antagonist)
MLVVETENRPLSLFPFVEGAPLNRDDGSQRDQAAVLLARLQRHFIGSTGHGQRPPTSANAPGMRKPRQDPAGIFDPNLDRYLSEIHLERYHLRAPIHGDFYRGNILCRDKRIQGLIDWDDCRIDELHQDFAWSIWEFAKDAAAGDRLDEGRAMRFVDVYRQSAGPVSTDELGFVVPLIRNHLRYEIRRDVAARENGEYMDEEYLAGQIRAFQSLKDHQFSN